MEDVYFNPRAPCGARPGAGGDYPGQGISIHAPRAGRDRKKSRTKNLALYFNPRAPCGARRRARGMSSRRVSISIHAPRAGRDRTTPFRFGAPYYFNPRAPCGARQENSQSAYTGATFQSTRPVRGATTQLRRRSSPKRFQSTRPVRGATAARWGTDTT